MNTDPVPERFTWGQREVHVGTTGGSRGDNERFTRGQRATESALTRQGFPRIAILTSFPDLRDFGPNRSTIARRDDMLGDSARSPFESF